MACAVLIPPSSCTPPVLTAAPRRPATDMLPWKREDRLGRPVGLLCRQAMRPVSGECGDQFLACLLAAPACLCAYPAMFMHLGMPLALAGAGAAGRRARLYRRAGHAGVVSGVPRQHPAGGVAEVGAVQVGAHALDQVGHGGFAKARVGAGRACLRTIEAFLDAASQGGAVYLTQAGRIRAQHLFYMRHVYHLTRFVDSCFRSVRIPSSPPVQAKVPD